MKNKSLIPTTLLLFVINFSLSQNKNNDSILEKILKIDKEISIIETRLKELTTHSFTYDEIEKKVNDNKDTLKYRIDTNIEKIVINSKKNKLTITTTIYELNLTDRFLFNKDVSFTLTEMSKIPCDKDEEIKLKDENYKIYEFQLNLIKPVKKTLMIDENEDAITYNLNYFYFIIQERSKEYFENLLKGYFERIKKKRELEELLCNTR